MAQYIDKDALVAKIEQFINKANHSDGYNRVFREGNDYASKYIIRLINTLEAKVVDLEEALSDLEKEIDEKYREDTSTLKTKKQYAELAKHFFELGVKVAQKGE